MTTIEDFVRHSPYVWELPRSHRADMRAPARVYVSEAMLRSASEERSIEQLVNVATLPGVDRYALAMPDIHQGYGFPIGGVAAIRAEDGVISPGGVGYDINCGVRLLAGPTKFSEVTDLITPLANQIQRDVPSGVGRGGKIKLDHKGLSSVLSDGLAWALREGFAESSEIDSIEESGCLTAAEGALVSDHAKDRGLDQLGTIGSGNHFLEIQEVVDVYDDSIAKMFGLFRGQVTVMIHTGSRGVGHQICTDSVRAMNQVGDKYGITLPDRELACAPFSSPEGERYFHAMSAAANFAWVNRQVIAFRVREAWKRVLGERGGEVRTVYDLAHNIAKRERHGGHDYIVHRKGATRAFGPGHPQLPDRFRRSGQPVLIPGSMGTYSYVLAGTEGAMSQTFGSCCHGAGRRMSRAAAKRDIDYNKMRKALEDYGVVVRAASAKGLLEESPQAYKDIDEVIDVVDKTGIAKKVARLKPVAIIKG